jgi:hypothetical protein
MRELLILPLLAISVFGQTGKLGAFTNSGDVGGPAIKGSTTFDATKGQYRITGAGANIWAKEDQFQYAWREMSGNMAVTATVQFLGEGFEHRKAGIMLRQTLDTDSPYIDIVIHGNGMPGLQWRNTKGDITNAVDFPFDGPAKYKLKLVRQEWRGVAGAGTHAGTVGKPRAGGVGSLFAQGGCFRHRDLFGCRGGTAGSARRKEIGPFFAIRNRVAEQHHAGGGYAPLRNRVAREAPAFSSICHLAGVLQFLRA